MTDEKKQPSPPETEDILITGEAAVALSYASPAGVPQITARGKGDLARELVRLAAEYHIPIKYDPDLVQVLSKCDVGENIPEQAYLAVAEILAFIYLVNQEFFGPEQVPMAALRGTPSHKEPE